MNSAQAQEEPQYFTTANNFSLETSAALIHKFQSI